MGIELIKRKEIKKELESDIQEAVMKWLKKQPDIECWKASDMYTRGVSDIILCMGGLFIAIELKILGKEPTPLQKDFILRINKNGGLAFYCVSLTEVQKAVDYIRKTYFYALDDIEEVRKEIKIINEKLCTNN